MNILDIISLLVTITIIESKHQTRTQTVKTPIKGET